jgi:homoserine O-succinyltransferase/O-acetyltransferase
MPVEIEAHKAPPHPSRTPVASARRAGAIVVGLVNNMPDSALESTEAQFSGLLAAGAGRHSVRLLFSSLPEIPRGPDARARIARGYWPIETLLAEEPDALIVTGTEPIAARLADEPYWGRLVDLIAWAEEHAVASVWSCLAAHAVVESIDGIQRRRLAEKRCGVFAHSILAGHALLEGVSAPLFMPHSRWNELPVEALRAAGYQVLSSSPETGADAFVRHARSVMLFFQGHPEYEDTTLLKEYRRDVGRFLSGEQPHYPAVPRGYLSAAAVGVLEAFREQAHARRAPELLREFPFAAAAAALTTPWRAAAVTIYRNWLDLIAAARTHQPEDVSLAGL